jgi:uncharacterized protein
MSRTEVKRLPKRARYDRETIYSILDEGFVCHVGFLDQGAPVVIPTNYARQGDSLILHGSAASRMLQKLAQGVPACLTVTLLDGLVLARSAFHHSVNYRSVVVFGQGSPITDDSGKLAALRAFMERLLPGRWAEVRSPNPQELKATLVLSFPIEEASAKIRTGPPIDDEADSALPVWAGVIPLKLTRAEPIPAPAVAQPSDCGQSPA